jgi:hypothetical protein
MNVDKIKEKLYKQKFENELEFLKEENFFEERINTIEKILAEPKKKSVIIKSGTDKFFEELEKYAFKKQWNRLAENHKLIKIKEFCDTNIKNDKEHKIIYKKLEEMLYAKKLNSKKYIDYDPHDEKILNILILQNEDGKYKLKD